MNRLVVKEVPKEASRVRPFELKPRVLKAKTITVEEEGKKVQRVVNVESPWPLDSDVARLIGEAKSLSEGVSLKLGEAIFITLHPNEVAWYAENRGLSLLLLDDDFYLSRRGGS